MPAYRESFVFLIKTPVPGVLWSGYGDIELPADSVLSAPTIALGGGRLLDIPDFEQLLNGTAQRLEIKLSGVNDETLALALTEAVDVPGAAAHIGRIRFDEDWQIDGPVLWEWAGVGVSLSVTSDDTDHGRTRSLTLILAAGDTTRRRAAFAYFTDSDQRRSYPTDAVFDHVASLNAGTSRRWGPK